MLVSIGASRGQVVVLAAASSGVAAAVGSLGAVVLAVAASPLMPVGPVRRVEPEPGVDVDLTVLGFGALAVTLALVAWGVWLVSRGASTRRARPSALHGALIGLPPPVSIGTRFALAVFTNIGVDHLDFHETQERYFEAKARLFDERFTSRGLVNVDDVHGRLLRDAGTIDIATYSLADLVDLRLEANSSSFMWRGQSVRLPLAGRFNVSNALAAAEAVVALGHGPAEVAAALATVAAPPGRFEVVDHGQPFAVIVDYAHTPDALANLLTTARELVAGGELRVVFGCGGDRDRTKRPQMGAVASELADDVMLTSDNPRSEDPAAIIAAVKSGTTTPVGVEIDRERAIEAVLAASAAGDVVVIAGKGHETTQTVGANVSAFDDRQVAGDWLAAHGWAEPTA